MLRHSAHAQAKYINSFGMLQSKNRWTSIGVVVALSYVKYSGTFRGKRMKRVLVAVMCAVFVFATLTAGYAEQGDWRGEIRVRIQESRQKIERGSERGTLNRQEVRRLNRELGTILSRIDRMKADGRLSHREREKTLRALDRLDRDIYREKHDGTRRH